MAVADRIFAVVPANVQSIPAIQAKNIHFPAFSDRVKVNNKNVTITFCKTSPAWNTMIKAMG